MAELPVESGVAFDYNGVSIRFDENRLINLTEMWESAGRPPNKDPRQWRRKEGSGFIAYMARKLDVPPGHIARATKGGRGGGGDTWGHWQIAVAYAKYLSHEYHQYVNEAFREWAEEKADPDLKAKRAVEGYKRQGRTDKWIVARVEGILARHQLTDTLKEHGVHGSGYSLCTSVINREVLGASAKEIKLARGVPAKASTRDHLSDVELAALKFAESMASAKVESECAHGNEECCDVCQHAGRITRRALEAMGLAGAR